MRLAIDARTAPLTHSKTVYNGTMSIYAQCPACGNQLQAPDEYAGRVTKCPHCDKECQLPGVVAASAKQSLGTCPDCGQKISKLAKTCPHCGGPVNQARTIEPIIQLLIGGLMMGASVAWLIWLFL